MKLTITLILVLQTLLYGQKKSGYDHPGGLILTSSHCSDQCCPKQEELYLFENGDCVFRQIVNEWNFDRLTYFGTWSYKDSLITVNYKKKFGGRGIGEGSENLKYGCTGIGYRSYKAFSESIDIHDTILWNEFKEHPTSSVMPIIENKGKPNSYRAEPESFNFLHSTVTNEISRIYSRQFLSRLTKAELRIVRNEIFARYGYIFTSQDLTEHFKRQSRYSPKYDNVDAFLNEQDKANLKLIKVLEDKN